MCRKNSKYLVSFIIIIILIIINQTGNYYVNYSITNKGSLIKANLLRFVIPHYYKYRETKTNYFELERYEKNKSVRKWLVGINEKKEIYYLLPETNMNAVGNYTFYIDRKEKGYYLIEVGMLIYPDSTSNISITSYKNEIKEKIDKKIKVNTNESLTERGKNLFDNLFSNSQFIEKINNETEKVKPSTSDNPQKYFSMNDFKF
jgi:hypothetical protein